MAISSSQLAAISVKVAERSGMSANPVPAHHTPVTPGAAIIILIVICAIFMAAVAQVSREIVSLYSQLLRVFAAVTSILLSIVFIAGVSVVLLIHR